MVLVPMGTKVAGAIVGILAPLPGPFPEILKDYDKMITGFIAVSLKQDCPTLGIKKWGAVNSENSVKIGPPEMGNCRPC